MPKLFKLDLGAWLWFALITVATIVANTQNNRFPFWFHPDEESKTTQMIHDSRDMTHPQLLLNSLALAVKVRNTPLERQQVVQEGRKVSAIFAGLAVGFMALLAWRLGGPLASVLAGLLLFGQPLMIECAHFLKEDTALLMGWALVLLALSFFWERSDALGVFLLGLAAGVCAAGKHPGVLVAVTVTLVVAFRAPRQRAQLAALCGIAALLTWSALNYRMFYDLSRVTTEFGREVSRLLGSESASDPPWLLLVRELSWAGGLCVLVGLVRCWRDRASTHAVEGIAFLLVGLYFIPLCLAAHMVSRYMLPLYMTFWWSIGLSLAWLISAAPVSRQLRLGLGGVLVAATLGVQSGAAWKAHLGFTGNNNHLTMARYIDEQLPAEAFIGYSQGVKLPDRGKKERLIQRFAPRQRMTYLAHRKSPPPDYDMLKDLRARGVTHVVVGTATMDHSMTKEFSREYSEFADFKHRKVFYTMLRMQTPLFVTEPGVSRLLSPELHLYKLPDAPPHS